MLDVGYSMVSSVQLKVHNRLHYHSLQHMEKVTFYTQMHTHAHTHRLVINIY